MPTDNGEHLFFLIYHMHELQADEEQEEEEEKEEEEIWRWTRLEIGAKISL